jgi:hypothetical protein
MTASISDAVTAVNTVSVIHGVSKLISNAEMKTCEEIRHENLLALIAEAGGPVQLSERYGCSEAYIKQLKNQYKDSKSGTPKGIGTETARRLEDCMEKERGWLDHQHTGVIVDDSSKYLPERPAIRIAAEPPPADPQLDEITRLYREMTEPGRWMLIGQARLLAHQYPAQQTTAAG